MAFQVSIGDGVLLAQIAWRLAKTFTNGRQSAPAEFQELENELYALSAALTAVENSSDTATQDVLKHILQNCKQLLANLEEIVNKYMVVSEKTDPGEPKLTRWSKSIVRNWRKIEWTTERGDIDSLRSQFIVHINSLNLLVTISTRYALFLVSERVLF